MINQIASIVWFFLVFFLLGYSIKKILKSPIKSESYLENIIITYIYGFVGFVILSYILNWLNLIYWWIYLLISLIVPVIVLLKENSEIKISLKKEILPLIVIIAGIIISAMLIKGAFVYPWLENDDSWDHAAAAYHIGENHNSKKSSEQLETFGRIYMDPYPPSYPIMMANVYQINGNVYWTLKFFNSLIIMFAIFFFYLFASNLLKNKIAGAISAITIGVLPSFMTHFIWSQTLAIILLIIGLYFLTEYKKTKHWLIISSMAFGALILTQQSTALIGYVMFSIFILISLLDLKNIKLKESIKQNSYMIYALLFGILLSLILFYGPMTVKYGFEGTLEGMGFSTQLIDKKIGDDTSGGIVYSFKEIINAPLSSKIDQQTGIGEFVSIISLLTIIFLAIKFKKSSQKKEITIIILWLIFCIIGIQSNALPIRLFPHRFWVFLSIPVALIFAKGILILLNSTKTNTFKAGIIIILLIGVGYTGAYPKYVVQNAIWPPGGNFNSNEMVAGYVFMKDNIPKSNVLSLCGPAEKVIGMNMKSPVFDLELEEFKKNIADKEPQEINSYIKQKGFEYVIVDSSCLNYHGENQTNNIMNALQQGNYGLINKNNGFILLKVP